MSVRAYVKCHIYIGFEHLAKGEHNKISVTVFRSLDDFLFYLHVCGTCAQILKLMTQSDEVNRRGPKHTINGPKTTTTTSVRRK